MRRVVITGIGVVAPGGVGTKDFWDLLTAGRTATRTITFFDPSPFRSRVAAECDFDPAAHGLTPAGDPPDGPGRPVRRGRRPRGASPTAACDARRRSTRTGSASPSAARSAAPSSLEREYRRRQRRRPAAGWSTTTYAVPHLYDYFVPSSLAAEVGLGGRRRGPGAVVSTGCTSGLDAVGYAVELIREGTADVMVAGATDAPISPITVACFDAIKATTPRNDDPEHASPAVRPHPQRLRARRGRGRVRPGGAGERAGGAARTSTPRSPATPPAATPTT